jgi:hypothetical protein
MILTPLNIQVAIIKAFYALAKKSVKYYTGLAFGKNNTCLFKEMRLLRAYVDILRNFEIVGSTITCSCCIEGDYTVLLNELSELTEARIQFDCDNIGSMFYNNISYPFTYFYDSDNKVVVIQFSTLIDPSTDNPYALTLEDVNFTEDCSFEPNTISPIEVGVIAPVGGTPIIVNNVYGNWDGNITIYEPDGTTILNIPNNPLPIPSNILNNPEAVAVYWNDNGPTDWLLLYDGIQFTMLTPFDGIDYSTYIIEYNQYEGGTNSLISPTSFIPQNFVPTGTRASTIVDIPNTFVGGVAATSVINTTIPPIDAFVTVPTQASTIVEIPTDIFSNLGAKAFIQFTAKDDFFRCNTNVNYIYTPSVNNNWFIQPRAATLFFANIEEIITYINDNSAFGYPLSLVSTSVITYPSIVDSSASTPFFSPSSYTAGDIFTVDLGSDYYNTNNNIGTYTVLLGDTNADVVAGLIADIIAQGVFTGTVTTDINDFLYFTAPVGTGSSWNGVYTIYIESITAGLATEPSFINGNNLTENEYTLSVSAPTEGSIYNTYTSFTGFGYSNAINSNFSGGDDPSQALPVEIVDTLTGQLYFTATNTFTSIDDFIVAFNSFALTQATNVGINGIYTQIEFKPPLTNTGNFVYNNEDLEFYFNNNLINLGVYANGNDTTECYYSLKLYDSSNVLDTTFENLTPANYPSLEAISLDIEPTFSPFGISINTNDEIATSYPYPFVPPTSLVCSTYNNYYFILELVYTSTQYSNYTSSDSIIGGGIDGYSETYEISDSFNNILLSRAQNTFNYPNGSEIQNGLIPDFNVNNPFLYSAEWLGEGSPTTENDATVLNNFLAELTALGITNGDEITAFIDSVNPGYIGKYRTPATGALPSYSAMITALNNDIIANNIVPGLTSNDTGSGIFQISPPTQAAAFNGKILKIYKQQYTAATVVLTFSGTTPAGTSFNFNIPGIGTIGSYIGILSAGGAGVANKLLISINALTSTTGITATRVGAVLTVYAPLFTGGGYNTTPFQITFISGSVVINGLQFLVSGGWPPNYTLTSFENGGYATTLIKQATFANGVASITTTKVKFKSPVQPLIAPEYGTGNWAFNFEFFFYDYNVGEHFIPTTYSGGIDPTVGQLTVEILTSLLAPYATLYNDITPQNYLSRQALVNTFNATNPFPLNFQISLFQGSPLSGFLSPPTSFDYFNNYKFRYSYDYVSPQYTDYVDVTTTFINGVDPVLTHYQGEFVEGNIGTFVTDNPCTPTIATQTCLTNNQASKIIQHINKLTK